MSRCTKCGATIKARSKSCEYCGAHADVSELESVLDFHEGRDKRQQEAASAAREHEAQRERYREGQLWKGMLLMFGILIVLAGIDAWSELQAERDTVKMPAASSEFKGDNYQDVQTDLRAAGFTSVEATAVPDLKLGLLKKPDEVKEVSVNGQTDWSDGSRFPTDARIVVRYHAFAEKE